MSKFAATYYINKYSDGFDGFGYELLDIQTMFESIYEETETIGEWTDTYDEAVCNLVDKPEGCYSVFVIGSIIYHQDYYGECDIDVEVEYSITRNLPEEFVEYVTKGE